MVTVNHATENSQNPPAAPPKLHWRHMDSLRWCQDDHHANNEIAVTPGRPPREIQRAHEYCKELKSVRPLINAGWLEYVRTEIYPGGASCEVYTTSEAGVAAVEAFYAYAHEKDRARDEAHKVKVEAERKAGTRIALRAALEEQFGGNYYVPALHDDITASKTPFLNVPLPEYAPHGQDGLALTIREYIIVLWYQCLDDELQKTVADFFLWGNTIGYEDAASMLRDRLDDDDDGDLDSPIGRIS